MKALLILIDGTVYEGESVGAQGSATGEVVFNTSMTGYQEILTDPSYAGQLVALTYPLIGNYGVNDDDGESVHPQVAGFIVKEMCEIPSNYRSTSGGDEYLKKHNLVGIQGVEACPHHFALTDEACRGYNTDAKMNPPLRTQEDVEAILEGLKDGTLDAIATDHAPHASYEKEQEFDCAPFGIIGIETMLSLSLKVLGAHLSLNQIIEKMTSGAAGVLQIDAGNLRVGARADVCVFDPDEKWILDKTKLSSKSKNTLFDGHEMLGKVRATIANGELIYGRAKP